jgi:hypothetical protein
VWSIYHRHYGAKDDPQILVAQGTSRDFNPTLAPKVIDRALERDPAAAAAAFLTKFRTDIEGFVAREAVDGPDDVVIEFVGLLKSYGVYTVLGDHYSGERLRERFQANGIRYEIAEKPKSDLYRGLLSLLSSGRIERLIMQLCRFERRRARSGKDRIGHAPGAHLRSRQRCCGLLDVGAWPTPRW